MPSARSGFVLANSAMPHPAMKSAQRRSQIELGSGIADPRHAKINAPQNTLSIRYSKSPVLLEFEKYRKDQTVIAPGTTTRNVFKRSMDGIDRKHGPTWSSCQIGHRMARESGVVNQAIVLLKDLTPVLCVKRFVRALIDCGPSTCVQVI